MFFLSSASLLLYGSALQATLHDAAHHAFMTLPRYARTRADEAAPNRRICSRGNVMHVPEVERLFEKLEERYDAHIIPDR
jgi:hypothetical protein